MTITHRRGWFAAVAALSLVCGLAAPASATAAQRRPTTRAALHADLTRYLASRGPVDHISAVSLAVSRPGRRGPVTMSVGTRGYGGDRAVPRDASWQIGSNTKAFTAVLLLRLEAEGKLSIHDTLGRWLPQYPKWRDVTIEQLLDMTSGIPDYSAQPAFQDTMVSAPDTVFTATRLVSYVTGLPLGGHGYSYSNTNYILAQMIIERATGDSYADQLSKDILKPLHLRDTCYAPAGCPAGTAARMPTGYLGDPGAPAMRIPPLALSWAQGAGGIVSTLRDMTTWDRALYEGRELPPRQQHELESLVSMTTGKPIRTTTAADPHGYGLGVAQDVDPVLGRVWAYEGGTFGYRVLHVYDPGSGVVIAVAANSSVTKDTLYTLAGTIATTLHRHGR